MTSASPYDWGWEDFIHFQGSETKCSVKGRGNTDTNTGIIMNSGTNTTAVQSIENGGPSSLSQGSSVPRLKLTRKLGTPKHRAGEGPSKELAASMVVTPPAWRHWWEAVVPGWVNP